MEDRRKVDKILKSKPEGTGALGRQRDTHTWEGENIIHLYLLG